MGRDLPQYPTLFAKFADTLAGAHDDIIRLASRQLARVEHDGRPSLWFCWAGGQECGTPHYYRVQGEHLLIEFDNAIDDGNHIHSVWRDYRNDLGHDLLADHYERERATGHHLATRLQPSVPDDEPHHAPRGLALPTAGDSGVPLTCPVVLTQVARKRGRTGDDALPSWQIM